MSRRLSTGTSGVFGIGLAHSGPVDLAAPLQRQRGREINGGILDNRRNPKREKEELALRISAALGVDRSRKVLNFNGESEHGAEGVVHRGGLPGNPCPGSPSIRLWDSVIGLGRHCC